MFFPTSPFFRETLSLQFSWLNLHSLPLENEGFGLGFPSIHPSMYPSMYPCSKHTHSGH